MEPEVKRAFDDIQQLGSLQTVGQFDLTTGTTSTVIIRRGVSTGSFVGHQALSASASNSDISRIVPGKDQFTVFHTSSGSARTFRFVFFTGS